MLFQWKQAENTILDSPPETLGRLSRESTVSRFPGEIGLIIKAQAPGILGCHGLFHDGCDLFTQLRAM